ncbi:MAG TPA: dTDP-4-dehydrorhamnose reductase, partial [Roseiflexaceae bacterium]|nr:dTDP-4-dehydrorhamnose reductase [Roseiflexaceae bacterium]
MAARRRNAARIERKGCNGCAHRRDRDISMKALIAGAAGQLGQCLVRTASTGIDVVALKREQLDLADANSISSALRRVQPDVVLNAAAYTAVDRAETESALAMAINGTGVAQLTKECAAVNARLIHVSTDYVFDGQSPRAYQPSDVAAPTNAYGASKLAGESAIAAQPNLDWLIVRTAWVYSPVGKNFLLTMLRLMRERGEVAVVSDQIGTPTSALTLARYLWSAAQTPQARGIVQFVDAGVASWYDFAVAIAEEA